jgi:phosphatidylglycerol:prolipoprotein diacylglycerol transferase
MWPYLLDPKYGSIPTYYLFLSLGFCAALIWGIKRAPLHKLKAQTVLDLSLIILIGGFFGARLAHVIFEAPGIQFSDWPYFFYFWDGGFVFYGAFLVSLAGSYFYLKAQRLSFLKMGDLLSAPIALGYGIGRLGCFFAGCCFGKYCPYPWAITYPDRLAGGIIEAPTGLPLHPTPLYMVFGEWLIAGLLVYFESLNVKGRMKGKIKPGFIFSIWLLLHGAVRFAVEQFRDDFRGPKVFNLSVSSWISVVLIACGLIMARKIWSQPSVNLEGKK